MIGGWNSAMSDLTRLSHPTFSCSNGPSPPSMSILTRSTSAPGGSLRRSVSMLTTETTRPPEPTCPTLEFLMVDELCRPVLRADSRLYHLGLDVVSFQVEPRGPRVFGRRFQRYHRRAAVAVRDPQTGESDVCAEIDEPSGRQLEGQAVTLVHPYLPDRLHIAAVQAIVELDASAYADPALAVAAPKPHPSGQAQKV